MLRNYLVEMRYLENCFVIDVAASNQEQAMEIIGSRHPECEVLYALSI